MPTIGFSVDEGPREPEHGDHHGCCFLQPPPSGWEVKRVLRVVGREEELEGGKPPTWNLQRPLANLQDPSPPLKYPHIDSHWKVRQSSVFEDLNDESARTQFYKGFYCRVYVWEKLNLERLAQMKDNKAPTKPLWTLDQERHANE